MARGRAKRARVRARVLGLGQVLGLGLGLAMIIGVLGPQNVMTLALLKAPSAAFHNLYSTCKELFKYKCTTLNHIAL